ncbi:MAG: DUF5107 domain-containing protein [Tannerella sp.]|nr:DUF5107 domain-containing protein [Tannerella sp.]
MKKLIKTGWALMLLVTMISCGKQASVREEKMTMLTYAFDDPDPVAQPKTPFYPYFTFSGYAHKGENKAWNTVMLENKYVRVYIIPAIGGKIWGAVEKTTGNEFLYFNHAVKFRNIAMRGPWTSGGIEPNFGIIGHAPTTATPVDYYTRKNDDGSVSCFVGALDLLTHTWWQEEICLPADKAYFTTSVTWHNSTPLLQPYYHWQNAAYKATDDLEMYFPGQYFIGHDGESQPWPIDTTGRDLSKYAQNDFGGPKSYHVTGALSDFYASYYKNSRFGSVHHAAHGDKLGMKIWIWGLSREGMIWENLLSDTDGQYVELQSGRLYNQAAAESNFTPFKQFAFVPYATDKWTEYWFPVKETGGVVKANKYGSLNVIRTGDAIEIAFCPVTKINDILCITANGKEIFNERLSLNVMQVWKRELKSGEAPLKIVLGDQKLVYSEDPADNLLTRPMKMPASFDQNSAYGLYLHGEQEMYMNHCDEAEKLLQQSLALEPFAIPALRDLATIYYRRGNWGKTDSCARIILSINAYDPDGNILYGLANSKLGYSKDAIDGFYVAALSASHRGAAYICLAREYARKGQWEQVANYAEKGMEAGGNQAEALQLKLLAGRKSGLRTDFNAVAAQMERMLPLNHFARFEKYAISASDRNKKQFTDAIRCELPHETLMEMAEWYESLGCEEETLSLYALNSDYPIANYRAAYLKTLRGEDGRELLKMAESQPIDLVFPSHPETVPALEWAVKQSDNWVNKYYLAILYSFLKQDDKAVELLEQCGNTPDRDIFYLTRAGFRQGEKKLEDLLTAETKSQEAWRAGMELIKYYQHTGQYLPMYEYARKYFTLYPDKDALGLKYALAMLQLGKYGDCTTLLDQLDVLPNEGAHEGHRVYREAWLNLAIQNIKAKDYAIALTQIEAAKQYPENLGVGKPYDEDIDLRAENFLTAWCYEKMNETANATDYYTRVIEQQKQNANELLSAIALLRRHDRNAANERIRNLATQTDSWVAKWCQSEYNAGFRQIFPTTATPEEELTDIYFPVVRNILTLNLY